MLTYVTVAECESLYSYFINQIFILRIIIIILLILLTILIYKRNGLIGFKKEG